MWPELKTGSKNHGSSIPAVSSSGREPAIGSAPPGAEPFSRLAGVKMLLTPPRDHISACLLQQKELHCPGPSMVPSPAKSSSCDCGDGAASPVHFPSLWGQEDDGESG